MTSQNRRRSVERRGSREPRDSGTAGAPPAIDGSETALEEFAKAPEDELNREALETVIKKALRDDAAFREEFAKLLAELKLTGAKSQTANVRGAGHTVVQVQGDQNDIDIG